MRYTVTIPGLTLFPGMGGQPDWARDLSPDQILRAVRKAEECGFSHLVIPWHMAISRGEFEKNMGARWPHSLAAAGMLLGATSRITVAPLVVAPCHNPIELAKALATLDWMSGGRCLPVILTGYVPWEFELLGADFANRDAITDETVEAMLALWGSDHPRFEGEFIRIGDMAFAPRPRGGRMPMWFGGRAKRALRRMAKYGDGWMSYATPAATIPAAVDYIRAQPGVGDRPLDIFCYFTDPTHDPISHEELEPPEVPVGDAAIIARAAYLGECGINCTNAPLHAYAERGQLVPATSFEAFLDRLEWFGREIIPATSHMGEASAS